MKKFHGNLELSDLQPRRPPIGHGVHTIARIQPMVPEPSMFVPSEQHNEETQLASQKQQSCQNSSVPAVRSRKPLSDITIQTEKFSNKSVPTYFPSMNKETSCQPNLVNDSHLNNQNSAFMKNVSMVMPRPHPEPSKNVRNFEHGFDHDLSCLSLSMKALPDKNMTRHSSNAGSAVINDTEVLSVINSDKPSQEKPNANGLKKPGQVIEILSRQNKQLINLQEQVRELEKRLAAANVDDMASKESEASPYSKCFPAGLPFKEVEDLSAPPEALALSELKNRNEVAHISTQTSAPTSPKSAEDHGDKVINKETEKTSASFARIDESKFQQTGQPIVVTELDTAPPILTPLGASGGRYQSDKPPDADSPKQTTPFRVTSELPLIQKKENKYKDLCPPEDINKMINDYKKRTEAKQIQLENEGADSVNAFTQDYEPTVLRRVKQMGISFLKAEDFQSDPMDSPEDNKGNNDYSMMWHPRAAGLSTIASNIQGTSDESLMLNSAALKYLNDEHLTQLAKNSPQANKCFQAAITPNVLTEHVIRPTDLSAYGIPETDLSKSTIQYLETNHLVGKK